ncbi:MAG: serine hydrolase domain-containing protein [Propionibacteriaceae bacterium]
MAKPVTAEVTLALVERGRLALDDPVRHHLPEFRLADPEHADRITIRHLLNHTSGLPASMQGLTDIADPDRRPADVLPDLAEVEPVAEPGVEFGYTSVDYAVLAAVIEAVTRTPYGQVARELLLGPIGSEQLITSSAEADATLPRGHRHLFGRATAFGTGYDPAGVSYGYLGGSLTDLARFAQLNLAGGTVDGKRVLEEASLQQAWAPSVDMSGDGTEAYGLGWRSKHLAGGSKIIWHSGAAPGYFAHVILLPEQQRAVVLLQNAHGELQAADEYAAGFGVADLLAGGTPAPITTGWTYPLAITLLTAAVLAAFGVIASTLVGLARGTTPGRHRALRGAGWVTLALALGASLVALPRWAGIPLDQIALWNPDLAVLVHLVIGSGLLLAGLRLWRLARGGRRRTQ